MLVLVGLMSLGDRQRALCRPFDATPPKLDELGDLFRVMDDVSDATILIQDRTVHDPPETLFEVDILFGRPASVETLDGHLIRSSSVEYSFKRSPKIRLPVCTGAVPAVRKDVEDAFTDQAPGGKIRRALICVINCGDRESRSEHRDRARCRFEDGAEVRRRCGSFHER